MPATWLLPGVRQDLPPAFLPDGGVIAVTRRALRREIDGVPDGPHAFFGADHRVVLTDAGAVIDDDGTVTVVRTVGSTTRSRSILGGRTVPQALLAQVGHRFQQGHLLFLF